LKLHLAKVLSGSVVVMKDASGKEIGRQNITPGADTVTINILQKLDRIELFKDWEYIGSLKYAYKENMPGVGSIRGEIFVQGGTFRMGSDFYQHRDEGPVHEVTVSDFWMMKTEVTQRDYIALIGANPSYFKGDDLPVEKVSWLDAADYANKLSAKDGLRPAYRISGTNVEWDWSANGWRLPTEAEWEYAARGGRYSRGYTLAGGNSSQVVAWLDFNSGGTTKPVSTKAANELGLYDLSGNVAEWCWDWYGSYSGASQTNPTGAVTGTIRANRGGYYNSDINYSKPAKRNWWYPGYRGNDTGFRLVRSLVR
jgi:formylglycine-generating enzyme required for sulfatase activity